MDVVSTIESKQNESVCLISICYFRNASPISIYNLVLYWTGNNILARVSSIQSVINLHYIPKKYPHLCLTKIATQYQDMDMFNLRLISICNRIACHN